MVPFSTTRALSSFARSDRRTSRCASRRRWRARCSRWPCCPARRWFPGGGLLIAGLLLAIAPGLVYFSRTAIHEILLTLFSALWAASLARFAARPSPGWGVACGARRGRLLRHQGDGAAHGGEPGGRRAGGGSGVARRAAERRAERAAARALARGRARRARRHPGLCRRDHPLLQLVLQLSRGPARLLRGVRALVRVWDDGAKPGEAVRILLGADGRHGRAPAAGWRSRPLRSRASAAIRRASRSRAGRSAPS